MSLDSYSDSSSDGQESPTEIPASYFSAKSSIVEETHELLVYYIGFRLRAKFKQTCLRGLPREYLVPPVQPTVKATQLRTLALKLEEQHDTLFQQICFKVDLSECRARDSFLQIAREIFSTGINWGRIVSLITFCGAISHHFIEQERPRMVCDLVEWLCQFIQLYLAEWMIQNGGWNGFVEHFDQNKPPKSFWTGVLAMGAVGAAGITLLALSK